MPRIFSAALHLSAAAVLTLSPLSASAQDSKEDSCRYQGEVMAAVQEARMKRVKEEKVETRILESEPGWPEQYSKAIPQLVTHVYAMKRSDLRNVDLGAVFEEQCLSNWDQIQKLQKDLQAPSD